MVEQGFSMFLLGWRSESEKLWIGGGLLLICGACGFGRGLLGFVMRFFIACMKICDKGFRACKYILRVFGCG